MSQALVIRRRPARATPMRTLRVGSALRRGGAARQAFPGLDLKDPPSSGRRAISGAVALLLHGGVIGLLLLLAWLNPVVPEVVVPVALIKEEPPPPPPVEKPREEPAPAPRALAERRSLDFAPQAQAVAPQVVNPTVVAQAAPVVTARKIDMSAVASVVAPKEISQTTVVTERVSAVTSVATAQVAKVDLGSVSAPALRGPADANAPAGPSVGPRQITNVGSTIGTGPATATNLGSGSSVREGIASNRDVLGSPTGARLANVNTRVGDSLMRGDGGNGPGGGGDGDCYDRPEVVAYQEQIRTRMYSRWILPDGVPASQVVQLRFAIDPAGSVTSVQPLGGGNAQLTASAVDALRAAAPFPPMSDRVRCLARNTIVGTFRNPGSGG